MEERRHGTAIAANDAGVLIVGPSGSGKSDLALRCMYFGAGLPVGQFRLVSDDQTVLQRKGDVIVLSAPATIAGKIEVRGVGIVDIDVVPEAPLRLIAELTDAPVERLPSAEVQCEDVLGLPVPKVLLRPFEASAPVKLALSLHLALDLAPH